jgi:hypothetical protein
MQYFFELKRGLARFEIDDEADADASRRSKLRLPQPLRLAFVAHNPSEFAAIHITVREDNCRLTKMQDKCSRSGNILSLY